MGNGFKYCLLFGAGLVIGAGGMYILMEDKIYQEAAEEVEKAKQDVEAIKEAYGKRIDNLVAEHEESISEVPAEYMKPEYIKEKKKFNESMEEKSFTDYTSFGPEITKPQKEEEPVMVVYPEKIEKEPEKTDEKAEAPSKPYAISDAGLTGYGMMGYERIQFTWYSDDILADDNDEMIHEDSYIDQTIGLDNFDSFVSNEGMDVMYVRNDRLETDFEIVKCLATYADKLEHSPRKMSDD